ncbi:hypothetical protein HH212_00125 [Massilia forsythiae]|uniref:Uncharacterized protein n=1 Tax=Massilia forsythiae TaxID=2728020 RepID=A0A7Z2ZR03_9BURK|nr:hypothetical protein [Massilia forsythiae]QJD98643.1 hypothetical protein HH212_00125 [Massilia forsythiae]
MSNTEELQRLQAENAALRQDLKDARGNWESAVGDVHEMDELLKSANAEREQLLDAAKAAKPLALIVMKAQEIALQAKCPGADRAAAIDLLADLLCKPETNSALVAAGHIDLARGAAPEGSKQ